MNMLDLCEMFTGIQGESTFAGLRCTFVRLAGCNLRCRWCDTAYAWERGRAVSVDEVLSLAASAGCPLVEVTGGEPLLQPAALVLMERLLAGGHTVLLETNGTRPLNGVPEGVIIIMDVKTPSSGHADATCWDNLGRLKGADQVKFVLADRDDYRWALDVVERYRVDVSRVLFSPVWGVLPPAELAAWILDDGLDVRINLQLHKVMWGDDDVEGGKTWIERP